MKNQEALKRHIERLKKTIYKRDLEILRLKRRLERGAER
jgi:hypothetical protein